MLKAEWVKLLPESLRSKRITRKRIRQQHYRCFICNQPLNGDINMDHVWPTSKGGSPGWNNRVLTHSICNSKKGDRYPTRDEMINLITMTGCEAASRLLRQLENT